MPARTQSWVQEIVSRAEHVLLHQTNLVRALSILRCRRIHGACFPPQSLEGYPHFLYEGWRKNTNHLDVEPEVTLVFKTQLPARYRGEGTCVPEKGHLELYSLLGNPDVPWQCSLHPESAPLVFCGAQDFEANTSWRDFVPFSRGVSGQLRREIICARMEKRTIAVAWPQSPY